MRVAIHITHEALYKIGGIGEVLNGLCTSSSYANFFERTLLYGPLFEYIGSATTRLGKDGVVYYSSRDHYDTGRYGELFKPLLEKYNVEIVYGKRRLASDLNPQKGATVDVLLVDVTRMKKEMIDHQKYIFWERFGITSDRYERDWDYEQYFRLAIPYVDFVKVLYPKAKRVYHFSHEYMGVPCLLALELDPSFSSEKHLRIFYAHEVAPVRRIVENHPGHDITFYNLLIRARERGLYLEDIFGSQMDWYRTALVKASSRLEKIFAVGDWVAEEYKFLVGEVDYKKIKVVYNGLPLDHIDFEEREHSRKKFKSCLNLKGCGVVDVIFSHTCRLVKSKGIWRDLTLLSMLDPLFKRKGLTGIYILLASQIPQGRPPELIETMVREYGWPFNHRVGWPDLVGYEVEIYNLVERFNAKAKAIRAIYINQYGLSKRKCGMEFPEDISTRDLKLATDVELGLSIYEPFGISHIEVLPSGGLPLLSTSCGVYFLLEKVFANEFKPYFAVDFISPAKSLPDEWLLNMSSEKREMLEELALSQAVEKLFRHVPKSSTEKKDFFERLRPYLEKLDWDYMVKNFFLPALEENP
uniref:Uncharacterized protein n=1 Tax=Caldimicrobium thiodismutans TaxID=1653476 RepID=A0A832GPB3_9BACT